MDILNGFLKPWMSQRMCQILLRCWFLFVGSIKAMKYMKNLFHIDSIHGTTTGADIFNGVENAINKKAFGGNT